MKIMSKYIRSSRILEIFNKKFYLMLVAFFVLLSVSLGIAPQHALAGPTDCDSNQHNYTDTGGSTVPVPGVCVNGLTCISASGGSNCDVSSQPNTDCPLGSGTICCAVHDECIAPTPTPTPFATNTPTPTLPPGMTPTPTPTPPLGATATPTPTPNLKRCGPLGTDYCYDQSYNVCPTIYYVPGDTTCSPDVCCAQSQGVPVPTPTGTPIPVPQAPHVGITSNVSCPDGQTYIAIFDSCLDFGQAISTMVSTTLIIGMLLAGMKLAIGAMQFVFSSGNPEKLTAARETLTDAALGLTLLVSAWVLLTYLQGTLPENWQIHFVYDLSIPLGGN